mmetsp:Transcript_19706/g.23444  ORF Transcript_19706/g.23444 Transcript_19706/m.23444 type:complete len:740 (+) Transcript_19706:67-2286(+)
MSWWQGLQEQATEYTAQLKEKAEELKVQATEQAEILREKAEEIKSQATEHASKIQEKAEDIKSQASEHATKIQEQAETLKQQYVNEDTLESNGINAILGRSPVPGDPQWERSVEALDFTYVTDRVVAMGMPHDRRQEMLTAAKETLGGTVKKRRAGAPSLEKPGNNLDVVASLLQLKHPNRFMVWNFSEEGYDYGKFDNQVLEFKFPGHPAPPLGLLFKICTSIENWLDADSHNVACLHCLTGKGRTATIMSCFLTWIGEASSVMEALQMVAEKRNDTMEQLTIPSQRRYLQYFSNMLDGVKPRSEPLLLRRIIMNSVPKFGTQRGDVRDPALPRSELVGQFPPGDPRDLGCCPYIQLFKGGKLLFTTSWQSGSTSSTTGSASNGASENGEEDSKTAGPSWCYPSEQSVAFAVDAVVQGDVLVRCRHLTSKGARVSMFRAAFHTGYVPCGVLRLNRAQLDGACADDRFEEDFFIDFIFAPVTSKAPDSLSDGDSDTENSAVARRERGVVVEAEAKDAYDEMLHRDSRFWDEVSSRKERSNARRMKAQQEKGEDEVLNPTLNGVSSFGFDDEDHDEEDVAVEFDLPSGGVGYRRGVDPKTSAALDFIADMESPTPPLVDKHEEAADLLEMLTVAGMEEGEDWVDTTNHPISPPPAPVVSEASQVVSEPTGGLAVDDELSALVDLEMELGLGSTTDTTAGVVESSETTSKPPVSAPADYDFDDDLDDFEGYLQSLTSTDKN